MRAGLPLERFGIRPDAASSEVALGELAFRRGDLVEAVERFERGLERLGASFRVTIDKRIAGAEGVGKHKTSMLQDVEAGKPLEIDGMLGVVIELGQMTGVETPALKALYACVSLLNKKIQDESVCVKERPLGQ